MEIHVQLLKFVPKVPLARRVETLGEALFTFILGESEAQYRQFLNLSQRHKARVSNKVNLYSYLMLGDNII